MRRYAIVPVEELKELEKARVSLRSFPKYKDDYKYQSCIGMVTGILYRIANRKWFTFSWFK